MVCNFCEHPEQFEHLKIKEYELWLVHLSPNQSYLGWCDISLKRHLEDIFEVGKSEAKELTHVVKSLKTAIRQSFDNDIFNYTSLGNSGRHVHLHVVPRYSQAVTFAGRTFIDQRWGKNYSPYDKEFRIEEKIMEIIKKQIQAKL